MRKILNTTMTGFVLGTEVGITACEEVDSPQGSWFCGDGKVGLSALPSGELLG